MPELQDVHHYRPKSTRKVLKIIKISNGSFGILFCGAMNKTGSFQPNERRKKNEAYSEMNTVKQLNMVGLGGSQAYLKFH